MSRKEDRDTPKCLFCSRPNEGQRYTFWGGFHVNTREKRAFLSSTTVITSQYRDMKKVGAFVCRECARRIVFRASLPTVLLFGACAAASGVGGAFAFRGGTVTGWVFVALAALFALTSLAFLVLSLFPNFDSWTSDAMVCKRAAPLLKQKGKGDSFFTEREYEKLFTVKAPERPEMAQEILEAAGITDADVRPRRSAGPGDTSDLTQCPNCAKTTPAKSGKCKWCGERLP